jgi:hypothetical protein
MDNEHELKLKIARANIEATKEQTKEIVKAINSIQKETVVIQENNELISILKELVEQEKEPLCVNLILK